MYLKIRLDGKLESKKVVPISWGKSQVNMLSLLAGIFPVSLHDDQSFLPLIGIIFLTALLCNDILGVLISE